jgi:hypothetical protein
LFCFDQGGFLSREEEEEEGEKGYPFLARARLLQRSIQPARIQELAFLCFTPQEIFTPKKV